MTSSIEINVDDVRRALARAPAAMHRHAKRALVDDARRFQGLMLERFRADKPGQYGLLHTRTGRLKQSVGYDVRGDTLETLEERVFSAGVPYADIQEFGGTIRPIPPRHYLTIPLPANLTGALVAREPSARALREREPGRTFIAETKKGTLLIGRRLDEPTRSPIDLGAHRDEDSPPIPRRARGPKRKARVEWLFVLVEEVTIPPRFNFVSTFRGLAAERRRRVVAALRAGIEEATRG